MRLLSSRGCFAICLIGYSIFLAPAYAQFAFGTDQTNGGDVGQGQPVTVQGFRPPDFDPDVMRDFNYKYVLSSLPKAAQLYLIDTRTYTKNNNKPANVDCNNSRNGGADSVGAPIQVSTGTKYETYPIFALQGEMGLSYVLFYNTNFVSGWRNNLDFSMDLQCGTDPTICNYITYSRPDGSSLIFDGKPGVGPYTERGGGGLATLTYNTGTGVYTLHDEDATTKTFVSDSSGQAANITSITDPQGVGWTISTSVGNGISTTIVTHTNGQAYSVVTGPSTSQVINGHTVDSGPITVTDPAGNVYTIQYDNVIDTFTYPGTPATVVKFKYDPTVSRLSEVDYNGVPYDYTTYDTTTGDPHYGWAIGNFRADNTEGVYITYGTDSAGNLQANLINGLGHQTTQTYDGTNGSGGLYNGQLSLISDTAVSTCAATAHGRSYDANGNLAEEIDNNGNIHTYTYAANGQLQTETEAYGTPLARTTDYVWDPSQQLNRLLSATVEGWSRTSYTYNSQNRLASVSETNLSAIGIANETLTTTYSYSLYSNGMVQTMTVVKPSPGGSKTEISQYNSLGQITSFTNGLGQSTTYGNYNGLNEVGHVVGPNGNAIDYTYDARGRLLTKTTYPNGAAATWTTSYDGFGLEYTLTGPDGQVTTWNRDPSSMRVASITHNDKDGTSTESFSYDANGDVLEHKIARGSTLTLDQVYHYDALGRVYQSLGQNGQATTYAYDGNGNTQSIADATGHTLTNLYDALNRLSQTTESGGASPAMPTTAPIINVPSSSTTGSYTVSWNSITGATSYVVQEQVGSGGWSTVLSGAALTWSPTNKATNTYSYKVKACNATGCSPFSSIGTISVAIPTAPTSAPSLSVPGSSANGNYTVSWTSVATAGTYTLQEQVNGGGWNTVQSGTSLSWSVSGKTNGTYAYRSQACNAVGCGPWSNTGTMVVSWPPVPSTPTLSWQGYNYTGSYTISWNGVPNASSYQLNMSSNGGSTWTQVFNGSATSWTATGQGDGTYYYALVACDISGCSAAAGAAVYVTIPTPIAINGHSYSGANSGSSGTGNEGIGFDIASGNTWEVFHTTPGNSHVVIASGGLPYGASTVQYTWTDEGVPAGMTNANGSISSNQASSPVAISSNPSTMYLTGTFSFKSANAAHQWGLRVDFYDTTGTNISSSSATLTGEVLSTQ